MYINGIKGFFNLLNDTNALNKLVSLSYSLKLSIFCSITRDPKVSIKLTVRLKVVSTKSRAKENAILDISLTWLLEVGFNAYVETKNCIQNWVNIILNCWEKNHIPVRTMIIRTLTTIWINGSI